ncbi:MAG: hypothetical protein BroJett039_09920 [Chloroflexota bacterium]|nr:MAG: hypothetical protein BroJett039_09920 [Chloroflexota bacterium]
MSNYELTFVLRPSDEATLAAAQERIATQLQNAGGEIAARYDWGRRRLAYPIQKNNSAYYTTLYVTLSGAAVRGIERLLKLNDEVLRYLVVRVDKFVLPQTAAAPAAPAEATAVETPAETPAETPVETAPTSTAETISEQPIAAAAEG